MLNTDNVTFNTLMDKLLSAKDRKLMMVTPTDGCVGVGMICFDPETVKIMEQNRNTIIAQLTAMDTLIMLSKLGIQMGVKIVEA